MPDSTPTTTITLFPEVRRHTISRYLYSHFIEHLGRCIYEGIWVGDHPKIENMDGIRKDTAEALKAVALPALRWPGGCFADNYHWMDGIGPREKRPKKHNLWWNQPESNAFGTDEFMRFLGLVGSEGYFCLNVGSGTVEEACSWVEYCNSSQNSAMATLRKENGHPDPYNVKFWGVGNENWGCGGSMDPGFYADLYRRFSTYLRGIAGPEAKLIACGSYPNIPDWDEKFFANLKGGRCLHLVDYIALHNYSGQGKSDLDFTDEDYYSLIGQIEITEQAITRACGLAQAYSTFGHRVGVFLDEWGTWWREAVTGNGNYQQNTLQDALFAAANFHMFHTYGEWLYMTNMAQTLNVLQALILTRGPEMTVTPTYHIYEMFKPHRDASLIPAVTANVPRMKLPGGKEREALSISATVSPDGNEVFISLVNLDLKSSCEVVLNLPKDQGWRNSKTRVLGGGDIHDHNTFEEPHKVTPVDVPTGEGILPVSMQLPGGSITTVEFLKKL
jgi:alpha-L-arabinofuranosidase